MTHYQIGTNRANDQHRTICGHKGTRTETHWPRDVTCDKCLKILWDKGVSEAGANYGLSQTKSK